MPIDLYYASLSPPCRIVDTVAKLLGLDLNIKYVDLTKGEQKTPEFLKLNPMHKVPTIDDNGYVLWESRVIITYFCNKYGNNKTEHLYPKDPQKRAVVDRLLYFDIESVADAFTDYVRPLLGIKIDQKIGEAKLHKALQIIEDTLLSGPFLTGDSYTIADICTMTYITTLEVIKFDLSAYPRVLKWINTLKIAVPSFEETNAKGLEITRSLLEKGAASS